MIPSLLLIQSIKARACIFDYISISGFFCRLLFGTARVWNHCRGRRLTSVICWELFASSSSLLISCSPPLWFNTASRLLLCKSSAPPLLLPPQLPDMIPVYRSPPTTVKVMTVHQALACAQTPSSIWKIMPPVFDRQVRCGAFVRVTFCIFMPVIYNRTVCAPLARMFSRLSCTTEEVALGH